MRIKWGNLLVFLLVIGGVVGYFQWDRLQSFYTRSKTTSVPVSKDTVIYGRDSWITGGIPELGLARDYQRDFKLNLSQVYYGSDTERLEALGTGKIHITEISFPSLLYNLEYVANGKYQDQIVVLSFIDYSRGGDGIVVKGNIKTVNDLQNRPVGYLNDGTGKYLLSFLLRMVDMRLADVKGLPYDDEEKLTADFASGKLDAITYWQPGINDVLKKVNGSKVLLSTADMPTLIPDVLVANRKFVADNPEKAESFLRFWFTTVKHIQERPDQAFDRWAEALNKATYNDGGKKEPIYGADNDGKGLRDIFSREVRLVGFEENLKLMGLTQPPEWEQMVRFAVDNWNRIENLKGSGATALFNNRVLDAIKSDVTLKPGAVDASKTGNVVQTAEKPKEFNKAADPGKLDEVAQMAIPNIEFEPNKTGITPAGRQIIETVLVPLLRQFPNFYLLIDGHTDVQVAGDDPAFLQTLSQGRADSVKRELVTRGFPEAQMIVRGFGGTKPIFANPKTEAEKVKNRRTEFRLLRDPGAR